MNAIPPKFTRGEFDYESYRYHVLGVVNDYESVRTKLKYGRGGQWHPMREWPEYTEHPANADVVVNVPLELYRQGFRGPYRLFVYKPGDYKSTLWEWEFDLGAAENAQTTSPFAAPPPPQQHVPPPWARSPFSAGPAQPNPTVISPGYSYGPPQAPTPTSRDPEVVRALEESRNEVRAANARVQQLIDEQRKDRERAALEGEIAKLAKAIEESNRRTDDRFEKLLGQIAQQQQAPRPNGAAELVTALSPFAATMTALLEGRSKDASAAADRDREERRTALERERTERQEQTKTMIALLEKKGPDPSIELLKDKLRELTDELRGRGQGDQADSILLAAMQGMQASVHMGINSFKAIAEMNPQQGGPIKELIGQALDTGQNLILAWAAQKDPAAAAYLREQMQKKNPIALTAGAPAPAAQPAAAPAPAAQPAPQPAPAAAPAQPAAPPDVPWYLWKPWQQIFFAMNRKEDPSNVGAAIAELMMMLLKLDSVPADIKAASDPANFKTVFLGIVAPNLPLWTANNGEAQPYLREIMERATEVYTEQHAALMAQQQQEATKPETPANGASADAPAEVVEAAVVEAPAAAPS